MLSSCFIKNLRLGDELRYLDASIPLCILTEEPAEKLVDCLMLMEKIESGVEKVKTDVFTIAEIVHILMGREKTKPQKARERIEAFLDCQGLTLVDVDKDLCTRALNLTFKYIVDFVDAYHILTMRAHGITEIYSLDSHYDRFTGIKRLEKSAR